MSLPDGRMRAGSLGSHPVCVESATAATEKRLMHQDSGALGQFPAQLALLQRGASPPGGCTGLWSSQPGWAKTKSSSQNPQP